MWFHHFLLVLPSYPILHAVDFYFLICFNLFYFFTPTTIAVVQKHHHLYVNSLASLIPQLLGTCLPPYSVWQHSTKMIFLKYKPDHAISWLSIIQWLPVIHVTPPKPSPAFPHILYHPPPTPSHLITPCCSQWLWHFPVDKLLVFS